MTNRRTRPDELLRSIPSWDDVRLFLALHRAGSLSAAAGPLGITQPTCGRRLAALEASLSLRLFDRTPSGLQITREGGALLEAASAMEQGARALALRAAVRDREVDGVVRIATNEAFATTFLVGAVAELRASHPGIRVELVLSNADADVLGREADLAIGFRPSTTRPTPEALIARKLGDEPFLLYASEGYLQRRAPPTDTDRLAGHEVVVYAGRHPASEWCARAFVGATVTLAAPSMQVTAAAIASSLGLGVLPRRVARAFPSLRALSPAVAQATGWLVTHPGLRRVPRIRIVSDTLATLFRAEPLRPRRVSAAV